MDSLDLDVTRKRAGEEFLQSLERLGLKPEALFWAFDRVEDRLVLVLATELFDLKGPLAVFDLLVKAYRASALPREIDPFVVRLHSPEHRIIRYLDGWYQGDADGTRRYGLASEQRKRLPAFASVLVEVDDVEFKTDWVYRFRLPERRDVGAIKREWARFHREVERLAAQLSRAEHPDHGAVVITADAGSAYDLRSERVYAGWDGNLQPHMQRTTSETTMGEPA